MAQIHDTSLLYLKLSDVEELIGSVDKKKQIFDLNQYYKTPQSFDNLSVIDEDRIAFTTQKVENGEAI